jgi:hypothetical protein
MWRKFLIGPLRLPSNREVGTPKGGLPNAKRFTYIGILSFQIHRCLQYQKTLHLYSTVILISSIASSESWQLSTVPNECCFDYFDK